MTDPAPAHGRARLTLMLTALVSVFILSHAFRTVMAIAADPLARDLGASPQALGLVAGAFHVAFALAQPAVGVALDRYGPRRTVLAAFTLAVIGSAVCALATRLDVLMVGQGLIGAGCAPALLAAMVFVSARYPANRFAALSGVVLAVGGVGMLITGTPLAWLMETGSWRTGFWALGIMAAGAWLAVFRWVDTGPTALRDGAGLWVMVRGLGTVLAQPHTAGICCLAAVSYAAFLALRGLWIGPLLIERHGFSVIEVGHAAFAISLAVIIGPYLFGRLDPGPQKRRTVILLCSAAYVVQFGLLALGGGAVSDVTLAILIGLSGGYIVLQYADVRSAYPAHMAGRALSVFTMALFLGVAIMQWLSGVAATVGHAAGDPSRAALLSVAVMLAAGTLAFWRLPWPPHPPGR
ncbi:MAG: MFS transporter [Pseudomonadota bacterium]